MFERFDLKEDLAEKADSLYGEYSSNYRVKGFSVDVEGNEAVVKIRFDLDDAIADSTVEADEAEGFEPFCKPPVYRESVINDRVRD